MTDLPRPASQPSPPVCAICPLFIGLWIRRRHFCQARRRHLYQAQRRIKRCTTSDGLTNIPWSASQPSPPVCAICPLFIGLWIRRRHFCQARRRHLYQAQRRIKRCTTSDGLTNIPWSASQPSPPVCAICPLFIGLWIWRRHFYLARLRSRPRLRMPLREKRCHLHSVLKEERCL